MTMPEKPIPPDVEYRREGWSLDLLTLPIILGLVIVCWVLFNV
jgi:hypothetical protein